MVPPLPPCLQGAPGTPGMQFNCCCLAVRAGNAPSYGVLVLIELCQDGTVVIEGDYVDLWDLKNGLEIALERGVHRVPINFDGEIKPVLITKVS
jgi:hypothetical protein